MRNEDLLRFMDYLNSEISRRKKFNASKLINSRTSYSIINGLYDCAAKTSADFEKFKASQDNDRAEILADVLEDLDINNFDELCAWAEDIKASSDNLVTLQRDGKKALAYSDFIRLVKLKKMSRKRADHHLRALMSEFLKKCDASFTAKDMMSDYLKIMSPADVSRLYDMLTLTLAPLSTKGKDEDSDSDSEPKAEKSSKAGKKKRKDSTPTPEPEPDDSITKLTAQVEELRVELESAYIRLNSSEENFERFQQESAELAVVDVLGRMNSQEAGKLLDQFAKSEQTLKHLTSSGYKIPAELSSVSLCVRMFMHTMRNVFMISPVHVIGERLSLTLEQSEGYDYSGSDFNDSSETKTVEVISPGWRHKNEVFSLPKVIECSE